MWVKKCIKMHKILFKNWKWLFKNTNQTPFWLFKFRWTHNTCSKFQGVTFRILFLGRKSRSFLLINAFKFWKTLMRPLDIKWTKVSFTVVLFLHMQMQELEHIIYRKEIYHKNIYIQKRSPRVRTADLGLGPIWFGTHL